jgi:serine protease DegQ
VSLAKHVMEDIIANGTVTRGWIGVEAQDVSPELADSIKLGEERGALVAGVLRGGPADRAGMRPGDVLVEIDGKPVKDSSEMLSLVSDLPPGKQATLTLIRNRMPMKVAIAVGKRPKLQLQ